MKKILLLFILIFSVSLSQAQTLQNPTFGNTTTNTLKIKTPTTVASVNFLTTVEADKSLAQINPVLLPLTTATINAINTATSIKQNNLRKINVEDYGVIGNGSTDNTTFLRTLFNDPLSEGTEIVFPKGDYRISDSIIVKYPCIISGSNKTIITQTSSAKTAFYVDANQVTFKNLTIDNNSVTVTDGDGIVWNKSDQSQLDAVFIKHFYKNVNIINGSSWLITNSVFLDPVKYNIHVQDVAFPDAGDSFISNCFFWAGKYANSTHIYQQSGGGLKIINNKFNATTLNYPLFHIYLQCKEDTSILLVQNNSFEGFLTSGVKIRVDVGKTFRNVLINNNQFSSYTADPKTFVDIDGTGGNLTHVNVQSNDMYASNNTVPLIKLSNASIASVSGNNSNVSNKDQITGVTGLTFRALGSIEFPQISDGALINTSGIVSSLAYSENATAGTLVRRSTDGNNFIRAGFLNMSSPGIDAAPPTDIVTTVGDGTLRRNSASSINTFLGSPTSGTYTPTLTGGSNVATIVLTGNPTYTRIGNVINVTVGFNLTVTTTGNSVFTITLPFNRIATTSQIVGTGATNNNSGGDTAAPVPVIVSLPASVLNAVTCSFYANISINTFAGSVTFQYSI